LRFTLQRRIKQQFDRLTVASLFYQQPCIFKNKYMSEEQLQDLNNSLRQLNVYLQSSTENQFKLTVIRGYNTEHDFQEALLNDGSPDLTKVLYNGAIFNFESINQDLFVLPGYEHIRVPKYESISFIHPLSDYTLEDQATFVGIYKDLFQFTNRPRVIAICDGHEHNTFQAETREVSTDGYWITVCRTVFLDTPVPRFSCDIYAPSSVRAPLDHNDLLVAPIGTLYAWPFALRGPRELSYPSSDSDDNPNPNEPTPPSSDDGDSSE
jgi:hypothetical protein